MSDIDVTEPMFENLIGRLMQQKSTSVLSVKQMK